MEKSSKVITSIDSLVRRAMGILITDPELAKARPWDRKCTIQEIRLYTPNLPGATLQLAWKAATEVCTDKQDIPLVIATLQYKIANISRALVGTYLDADTAVSCDSKCEVRVFDGNIEEASDCRVVRGISTAMMFTVRVTGPRHSQDYTSALIRMLECRLSMSNYTRSDLADYMALRRRKERWNIEVLLLQVQFARDGWSMFTGDTGIAFRSKLGNIMVDGFRCACLRRNCGELTCNPPTIADVEHVCNLLIAKCDGVSSEDLAEAAAARHYAKAKR